MHSLRQKLSENLILLVLASFVFISIFGMSAGLKNGEMSSCPFMIDQESMCEMSVTEHITKWQAVLTGIPTNTTLIMFALVLLATALIPFVKPFSELKNLSALTARMLAYQRAHFAKIFDPLLLAFSDGILNPKIYEPVRI